MLKIVTIALFMCGVEVSFRCVDGVQIKASSVSVQFLSRKNMKLRAGSSNLKVEEKRGSYEGGKFKGEGGREMVAKKDTIQEFLIRGDKKSLGKRLAVRFSKFFKSAADSFHSKKYLGKEETCAQNLMMNAAEGDDEAKSDENAAFVFGVLRQTAGFDSVHVWRENSPNQYAKNGFSIPNETRVRVLNRKQAKLEGNIYHDFYGIQEVDDLLPPSVKTKKNAGVKSGGAGDTQENRGSSTTESSPDEGSVVHAYVASPNVRMSERSFSSGAEEAKYLAPGKKFLNEEGEDSDGSVWRKDFATRPLAKLQQNSGLDSVQIWSENEGNGDFSKNGEAIPNGFSIRILNRRQIKLGEAEGSKYHDFYGIQIVAPPAKSLDDIASIDYVASQNLILDKENEGNRKMKDFLRPDYHGRSAEGLLVYEQNEEVCRRMRKVRGTPNGTKIPNGAICRGQIIGNVLFLVENGSVVGSVEGRHGTPTGRPWKGDCTSGVWCQSRWACDYSHTVEEFAEWTLEAKSRNTIDAFKREFKQETLG